MFVCDRIITWNELVNRNDQRDVPGGEGGGCF